MTTKVMEGTHAISHGVTLSRARVIAAYPITPSSGVVGLLSEMSARGRLAHLHDRGIGALGDGRLRRRRRRGSAHLHRHGRSHGLADMHEMLHWGRRRLPIVLTNVSRAMAPGWSIWSDQTDILSDRDIGWIRFAESVQEVHDSSSGPTGSPSRCISRRWWGSTRHPLPHRRAARRIQDQMRSMPTCRPWSRSTTSSRPTRAPSAAWRRATATSSCAQLRGAMEAPPVVVEAGEREFGETFGRRYTPGSRRYLLDDADGTGHSCPTAGPHLERPPAWPRPEAASRSAW